jgi:hypothetical protein
MYQFVQPAVIIFLLFSSDIFVTLRCVAFVQISWVSGVILPQGVCNKFQKQDTHGLRRGPGIWESRRVGRVAYDWSIGTSGSLGNPLPPLNSNCVPKLCISKFIPVTVGTLFGTWSLMVLIKCLHGKRIQRSLHLPSSFGTRIVTGTLSSFLRCLAQSHHTASCTLLSL